MTGTRAPRPEIARSRRQLLDAAEALFLRQGLEFSLNELAHEAGLGVATTYRRFASHDDVVRALHERAYAGFVAILDALDDAPDGWSGVVGYLERAVAMSNAHPSYAAAARRMARIDPASALGQDLEPRLAAHVRRAQEEGALRTDATAVDLVAMVAQLGVLTVLPEPARTAMSARQLGFLVAGLRAESQAHGDAGEEVAADLARLHDLATQEPFAGRGDAGAAGG
ncbi:TetR/AcrR family transcriptional regulator [Microbacterium excoecariae]|uniref:TetR/AcrR family transcriptional regulator n=1 Tax=Microbacterium excoecariae TaxID=2715210 RepID=UPI001407661B|nr:TetR/AcrR family transcriptional regulator [Microbacterium excoecariae]NHI17637.1 TetR/AcrR family transcriptional regulator [Microbacterium excoecariae]